MATMTETPAPPAAVTPSHEYHAEAQVLSGNLRRPIEQVIEPQAPSTLRGRRSGHLTRFTDQVSIDGLVSFKMGFSRVSGTRSLKHDGWITLSTSVVDDVNVLEVITADRIVSQVSTDHVYGQEHFPSVTFLGTQLRNLRISGLPVQFRLNYQICGGRPLNNKSYLDKENAKFLADALRQAEAVCAAEGLPAELKKQYDENRQIIAELMEGKRRSDEPKIVCSLVEGIQDIPEIGAKGYGHVLVIPGFGAVSLGEIEVAEKPHPELPLPDIYFKLQTFNAGLGCIAHGAVQGPIATANGHHSP